MGQPPKSPAGRPRHAATDQVVELFKQPNMTVRKALAALELKGITIAISTIHQIRKGTTRKTDSLLAGAERRLAAAVLCPNCRDAIDVVPCRICGATWPSELDDVNRAAERRALALSQQRPGALSQKRPTLP